MGYLTNRFHVAERLFSNRSQMTSKCGKNKNVAHEAIAECVTDVLMTSYIIKKQTTAEKAFFKKIFQHDQEPITRSLQLP